jgi:hypothetical protein
MRFQKKKKKEKKENEKQQRATVCFQPNEN